MRLRNARNAVTGSTQSERRRRKGVKKGRRKRAIAKERTYMCDRALFFLVVSRDERKKGKKCREIEEEGAKTVPQTSHRAAVSSHLVGQNYTRDSNPLENRSKLLMALSTSSFCI